MIIRKLHVGIIFLSLFFSQTEGKHLKTKTGKKSKTDHNTNTTTPDASKNIQRSKLKHVESGKRRQFLTGDANSIFGADTLQQNVNRPSSMLIQDNVFSNQELLGLPQNDNAMKLNLPFAAENSPRQATPFQIEKPLPIPLQKTDLRLVPKLVPLRYAKEPDVNVAHVHFHQGLNPCQNGGLVVQSPGGYSCLCRKEYKGNNCQEKELCFPNPCKNGGNCLDHTTHLQCVCAKGFKGLRCEKSNSCDKNPCKNGATCLDLKQGLHCICALGYKGGFCTEMDFCNPNPCKNGGTCTQKNIAPVCLCKDDYKGTRCEAKKICLPNPCRNNGICKEERSTSPCECAQGFTGKYCTDHVCAPNPCLNGGACTFQKSLVSSTWLAGCKCTPTSKGTKCEIPNPCAGNPSPCKHGVCFDAFTAHRMDIIGDHFICNCHRGFMGPKCDVRKCDKCDTNAKCQNEECVCNDGYYGNGHVCKKLPDPCIPNPCKNFGKCVPFESSYDCKCPFSFVGERCEQQF